jgi:hypothetical protein
MSIIFRMRRNAFAAVVCALSFAEAGDDLMTSPGPSGDLDRAVRRIRESWFQRNEHLEGNLRMGSYSEPFYIALRGPFVEITLMRAGRRFRVPVEGSKSVEEFRDGHWAPGESMSITTSIGGTLVSFEDMAFRFLFWPKPREVGTGMIRTKVCALVRLTPPAQQSEYEFVILWLDEDSLIPLRAVCYVDDKEIKRFDPVKLRKVEDEWIVQSIRVTCLSREAEPGWTPTYIEFESTVGNGEAKP